MYVYVLYVLVCGPVLCDIQPKAALDTMYQCRKLRELSLPKKTPAVCRRQMSI